MTRAIRYAALVAAALHVSAAWAHEQDAIETSFAKPGDPAKVTRTVKISMSDAMRFTPPHVEVKRGDTVRFLVTNNGKLIHEMVLGTTAELKQHAKLMRQHPGMEHDEPNVVSVQPGKTESLVLRFQTAGVVDFACLVPGHFEAGMRGIILVR